MKPIQNLSAEKYATPNWLIESIRAEFGEFHDPCPIDWKEGEDKSGLVGNWPYKCPVFVNPPYARGKIGQWAKKCYEQWERHNRTVILLIPAYTDTSYFHEYILPFADIKFLRGRLKFNDGKTAAPFPSILCIYRKMEWER